MKLTQEKLQLLRIYGVLKETIKLISTSTTIFAQITLTLLLPLSLLIFTQSQIPNLPFKSALLFFSAALFLLSSAAAVFAAASTFVDRPLPFHQLLCIAPKLCKQHLITFLCLIFDFLAFNLIALPAIALISVTILSLQYYEPFQFLTQLVILFLAVEAFYFALIWQISSAVSVFEADSYGFEAIARSKELLEGKMVMGLVLLGLISLPFGGILFVVRCVGVGESALWVQVGIRGILGVVWIGSFLLFLLSGTVLYLDCKSCRLDTERIDKLELSAHLQGYLPVDCEASKVEDDDEIQRSLVD